MLKIAKNQKKKKKREKNAFFIINIYVFSRVLRRTETPTRKRLKVENLFKNYKKKVFRHLLQ
jgi:hypothetical protein